MPVEFWVVWLFVLGACVGSFLNVCIYRLPAGLSILWPPSHCPKCLNRIAWYDNLPILSYFILRGRCRRCREPYSMQYAVVEALTGLLFVGFYVAYFLLQARGEDQARWSVYAVHMALASALIVESAIDFRYKEIFTIITNGGMALAVVLSAVLPELQAGSRVPDWFAAEWLNGAASSLVGMVVGGGMIWITAAVGKLVFRREAMGFGDVLLMGLIGAVLGWEAAVLTFFLAPFFGLAYGVWQLARHKEHEVPYGPFLSLACGVAMVAQGRFEAWFGPGLAGIWQLATGG
jgi:leader peptidase (prepilin peptidase)/N-methyltransferase